MLKRVKCNFTQSKLKNAIIEEKKLKLNVKNPLVSTFTRNSEAYDKDGHVYAANTPVYGVMGKNMIAPFTEHNQSQLFEGVVQDKYKLYFPSVPTTRYTEWTMEVEPNTQYTLSFEVFGYGGTIALRKSDGSVTYSNTNYSTAGLKTITFTTDAATFEIYVRFANNPNKICGFENPQLELGGTNTDFEPMNKGILMTEKVINLVTDPDFVTNTDWFYGDGSTITTNKYGDESFIVASTAAAGTKRGYVQKIISGVTENLNYVAQVKARKVGAVDNCQLRLSWYDAADVFLAGNYITISDDLTEDWKTFSMMRTAPAGAVKVHFYPVYDGGTQLTNFEVEMTQPQLQQNTDTSDYINGTKAKDALTIPSSFLDPDQGTIELELYPKLASTEADTVNSHDIAWMDESGATFKGFLVRRETNAVRFFNFVNGSTDSGTYSTNWNAKDKLHYTITWDKNNAYLYLNGVLRITRPKFTIPVTSVLQIGSRTNDLDYSSGNAWYTKLKITNRKKVAAEVADDYAKGFYVDSDTEVFMNFDGNVDVISGAGAEFYPVNISEFTNLNSVKLIAATSRGIGESVRYSVSVDNGATWNEIKNGETLSDLGTPSVLLSRVAISSDDNTSSPEVFEHEFILSDGTDNYLVVERSPKYSMDGVDKMDLFVGEVKDVEFDVRNRDGNDFTISSSTYELVDSNGSVAKSGSGTISSKTITVNLTAPTVKGTYELRVKYVIGSETRIRTVGVYVK